MKKQVAALSLAGVMALSGVFVASVPAGATGEGPDYRGNETVQTQILHTYQEMADYLKTQDEKQKAMQLEVIGKTVKGRDVFLVKYITDKNNPTVLFLTQQHGNEQLTTEGALEFIKHLGTSKTKGLLEKVNILIVPMLNADGAMGDVNFSLDDYIATGRHLTRYNAVGTDLNRDHVDKLQPETQALHEKVLSKYSIDYMIDLHHQGTQSEVDGKLVSGSILYPTNDSVASEVVEKSKRLGAIVYHSVDSTGWGHIGKYDGGSALTIARNGIAKEYGIATLLFEMRGMSDHSSESAILGQKSNGYLIKQTITTLDATVRAIADGTIETVDASFWDTLPEQTSRSNGEADE
ncbi:M14 family zinc carboxypeptidase [Brevibacillus choshinensis]|uniref:M14 family zinc carboxypeptidase n=1 Tax=Brevibacillus choshinensis TaxID=54911 RepID=UPI002E23D5A7|nr:M14 family zinc carboxypeptidase [Brevibacillus choshinensis]MED4784058.1 M14 family zinc carboxypeptidase [Brevibacillus choshinensis]